MNLTSRGGYYSRGRLFDGGATIREGTVLKKMKKKNWIRFDVFMQFWKKDADFEVNIAENQQITKSIDTWGKNLQKSQTK